ncbi:protein downstream neighbor of son homolog isoform X2 [Poeciliopsis prolifica]|uniref:protein downstream neighbor of son homolog isoform X2 n=1 Tax=Poeciliopsis prolifica TaxID=188132 RepID=UPI002413DCE2|nr:protein downstream neighbor of son homolog isoform X2 [Poeciliopsis prolifica]
MAEQGDSWSSCKRPAEVVRLRRKRVRSVAESPGASGSSPASGSSSATPSFHSQSTSRGKRRNPFLTWDNTVSRPKKVLVEDGDCENVGTFIKLMSAEKTLGDSRRGPPGDSSAEKSLSEDNPLLESEEQHIDNLLLKNPLAITPVSIEPVRCADYPADWSLKTRVIFTSPVSLSWTGQPKAQEEALGLSNSCRAKFTMLPHNLQEPRSWSDIRSAFQQSLVYWQYPSLPWLTLFPRINAEKNFSGKNMPWTQDEAVHESLVKEWSVSLSSLYSLLKVGLCPYFYVCSYQFTVLFKAPGLAGSDCITALISPTTRGLREAMKTEGVEFSLPLLKERRRISEQHKSIQKGEEEMENENQDLLQVDEDYQNWDEEDDRCSQGEDDSLSWLKEIGIQDKLRKPECINIQLQKEAPTLSLDHKPESAVCVEGSHSFNLINFLINWKSVVAAAGSQTGLPPTLLAPTAFRGATMNVLKSRSVNVKNLVDCTYQNISSLELTGPILPSSLHAITTLLQTAQKGNFSAALYTHAPTAVMNTEPYRKLCSKAVGDLAHCGLPPASIDHLQQPSTLGKTTLTHITMNNYSYTWKIG